MANKILNFFTGGLAQASEDYYIVCKLGDEISPLRNELINHLSIKNRDAKTEKRMKELRIIINSKELIYEKYIKEHPAQI